MFSGEWPYARQTHTDQANLKGVRISISLHLSLARRRACPPAASWLLGGS